MDANIIDLEARKKAGDFSALSREDLITAARMQGETVATQQSKYQAEINELHDQIRTLQRYVLAKSGALATFKSELEDAIVSIDGERFSLFDLYEQNKYQRRCQSCHETDCDGCSAGACV